MKETRCIGGNKVHPFTSRNSKKQSIALLDVLTLITTLLSNSRPKLHTESSCCMAISSNLSAAGKPVMASSAGEVYPLALP